MGIHYDVLLFKKERAEKEDNRIDKPKVTSVGRASKLSISSQTDMKKSKTEFIKNTNKSKAIDVNIQK